MPSATSFENSSPIIPAGVVFAPAKCLLHVEHIFGVVRQQLRSFKLEHDDRWLRPASSELGRQPVGLSVIVPANGDEPSSFELVTRRGLDDLTRQVDRIERELTGLLFGLAGSILIELYRTIVR
jgi:hypothetical protein